MCFFLSHFVQLQKVLKPPGIENWAWKLPPCFLAFLVLEGDMQVTGGEKPSILLPGNENASLLTWPDKQDMSSMQ